jgi:digeranylgeranylglycerophospholipid reductase
MAAMSAAAAGRRVCLLERKARAGLPAPCREGIGYKGLTLTLEPRPEWIKREVTRARMVSPSGINVEIGNVDKSWILDRERMDSDLVKMAIEKGAEYFPSTPIISAEKTSNGYYTCVSNSQVMCNDNSNGLSNSQVIRNDNYNGLSNSQVTCNDNSNDLSNSQLREKKFTAPCLILADGVESRLARCFGWDTALRPKDIEACAFARVKSQDIDPDSCVFYTGSKAAPGGYLWLFPRGEHEANVGLGVIGTKCTAGLPKKLLLDFIKSRFKDATVTDLHCGGVPVGKWIKPLVKEGVMLVGDAARQVNAINGAGIAYSLYAGKTAGETAAKSFRPDGTTNPSILIEYKKKWAKNFGKQQLRSFALKEFIQSADDKFLDKIAAALSKEDPKQINYLRVFTKTFASKPLLLLKAFRLFR